VVEDPAQRALLAETLMAETKPPGARARCRAQFRRFTSAPSRAQRELRTLIAEAERRGDYAELALLTQQKLDLDRALASCTTSARANSRLYKMAQPAVAPFMLKNSVENISTMPAPKIAAKLAFARDLSGAVSSRPCRLCNHYAGFHFSSPDYAFYTYTDTAGAVQK